MVCDAPSCPNCVEFILLLHASIFPKAGPLRDKSCKMWVLSMLNSKRVLCSIIHYFSAPVSIGTTSRLRQVQFVYDGHFPQDTWICFNLLHWERRLVLFCGRMGGGGGGLLPICTKICLRKLGGERWCNWLFIQLPGLGVQYEMVQKWSECLTNSILWSILNFGLSWLGVCIAVLCKGLFKSI